MGFYRTTPSSSAVPRLMLLNFNLEAAWNSNFRGHGQAHSLTGTRELKISSLWSGVVYLVFVH